MDIDEINRTILMLEDKDTTYATCEKLADLYIVRDHMTGLRRGEPLEVYGESEFLWAVDGKDSAEVWSIMDELMNTLSVVNPKAYNSVMEKIKGL